MYIDRRYVWSLVLALVSVVIGLVLLTQGSVLVIRGTFIQLPALLLIIYGLVVAWWHTKRAVSVFEVQTARAVHRALRNSLGHMR
jgi:flagellar motor component MotA